MLLHISPRLRSSFRDIALVDIKIEPFGPCLRGGRELKVRRPFPNKTFAVVCRRNKGKAVAGFLIKTASHVDEFSYTAQWAIGAELVVTHKVTYKILDTDFDAASDNMVLWYGTTDEWEDRWPAWAENL